MEFVRNVESQYSAGSHHQLNQNLHRSEILVGLHYIKVLDGRWELVHHWQTYQSTQLLSSGAEPGPLHSLCEFSYADTGNFGLKKLKDFHTHTRFIGSIQEFPPV